VSALDYGVPQADGLCESPRAGAGPRSRHYRRPSASRWSGHPLPAWRARAPGAGRQAPPGSRCV